MSFLAITIIGLLMIISPGPDFAVVVKNSLTYGRASGIRTSIGIGIANFCHVMLNIIGIGVIFYESALAFNILKVAGAVYLILIGLQSIKNALSGHVSTEPSQQHKNPKKQLLKWRKQLRMASSIDDTNQSISSECEGHTHGFYSGFCCSLLNPKAFLFYLSFFSVMLPTSISASTKLLYGGWLSSIAITWFILVACFFTIKSFHAKLLAAKRWIELLTGTALIGFASKILLLKFTIHA